MFTNSAGFKFRGGNFYNVSGDVHLQAHQHLTIQGLDPHEAALQLPVSSEDGRELPGIARNLRSSRPAPYGVFKYTSLLCCVSFRIRQIYPLARVLRQALPIMKSAQDPFQRPRAPWSRHSRRSPHIALSPTPHLNLRIRLREIMLSPPGPGCWGDCQKLLSLIQPTDPTAKDHQWAVDSIPPVLVTRYHARIASMESPHNPSGVQSTSLRRMSTTITITKMRNEE